MHGYGLFPWTSESVADKNPAHKKAKGRLDARKGGAKPCDPAARINSSRRFMNNPG